MLGNHRGRGTGWQGPWIGPTVLAFRLGLPPIRTPPLTLTMPRPTPYDLAFGAASEERFQRIGDSLARTGADPHDLDAFVLDREVVGFLRELVPEEGIGEAVREHLALLHHAWLYWAEGGWLVRVTRDRARRMLAAPGPDPEPGPGSHPGPAGPALPRAFYLQLPEQLLWADVGDGGAHQPVDGAFVRPWPGGGLFVLAVTGMHPGRDGFTVVEADGHPGGEGPRSDGRAPFAPVLPGGEAAGLFSLVGEDDLLELGSRALGIVAEAADCAGPGRRAHHAVEVG